MTSAPAETSTTGTAKETEPKDGSSGDINDAVNSSSNESSSVNKTAKDTENLKRPLVEEEEEVKQKKRKEDYSQSSKGT